jgi:hypothetical protein
MKKSLGPVADVRSLRSSDPMGGFFVAAVKPVSVSAFQRHHIGSTTYVVGDDASKAFFSKNPVCPRQEGAKSP